MCPEPDWFLCHLGMPDQSTLQTKGAGSAGSTRRTYLEKLLGENFIMQAANLQRILTDAIGVLPCSKFCSR